MSTTRSSYPPEGGRGNRPRRVLKPGPQPCNRISGSAEAQIKLALEGDWPPPAELPAWMARAVRELIARELPAAVAAVLENLGRAES